jgi:hypothetical protein
MGFFLPISWILIIIIQFFQGKSTPMIIFFHSYVVFFLLKCHAPPSLVSDSKIGKCYSIIIHEIGRKKPILDASDHRLFQEYMNVRCHRENVIKWPLCSFLVKQAWLQSNYMNMSYDTFSTHCNERSYTPGRACGHAAGYQLYLLTFNHFVTHNLCKNSSIYLEVPKGYILPIKNENLVQFKL